MAELLGELGRQGKDGMGHALIVGVGIGKAPPGQKRPVNILPDAVGVDEGAVQIKEKHVSRLLFQPEAPGKVHGLFGVVHADPGAGAYPLPGRRGRGQAQVLWAVT